MDGDQSKDNHQLILRYRGVSMHPEVDMAIEEVVNESISASELESSVELSLDHVEAPDKIKDHVLLGILKLCGFPNYFLHSNFSTREVDTRACFFCFC